MFFLIFLIRGLGSDINNVTRSLEDFERFASSCLKSNKVSMTLACIPCKSRQATPKIGRKKVKASSTKASALPPNHCPELGVEVVGKVTQRDQAVSYINCLVHTFFHRCCFLVGRLQPSYHASQHSGHCKL